MGELFFDMMHNELDGQVRRWQALAGARRPPRTPSPRPDCAHTAHDDGGDNMGHTAVPFKALLGYKGGPNQNCSVCGKSTTFCCSKCSTADSIFAVHPPSTMYGKASRDRDCLEQHRSDPSKGKRRHPVGRSGKRTARDESEDEGEFD